MSDIIEDVEAVSRSVVKFLKGTSFIPILFIIQLFILINGETFFQISDRVTVAYIILPWLLMGVSKWYLDFKPSELIDMTNREDYLSDMLRGGHSKIRGRSFEIQIIWAMISFLSTWFILIISFKTFNWPEPGLIMESQKWGLRAYHIFLVSISETLAFHAILPIVLGKMTIQNSRIKQMFRYGVSQSAFALFHLSAYWGDPDIGSLLLFSFMFGTIFLAIADHKRGGLALTMGVHACWNLWVVGAISGVYLGV